jgi:two-component system cell cycle sensor histidine kinase PleC
LLSHPGTGLGLSLAIELTRLHGGTLEIRSAIGAGTSVTVDLPADRCVKQPTHV